MGGNRIVDVGFNFKRHRRDISCGMEHGYGSVGRAQQRVFVMLVMIDRFLCRKTDRY